MIGHTHTQINIALTTNHEANRIRHICTTDARALIVCSSE